MTILRREKLGPVCFRPVSDLPFSFPPSCYSFCSSKMVVFVEVIYQSLATIQLIEREFCAVRQITFDLCQGNDLSNFYNYSRLQKVVGLLETKKLRLKANVYCMRKQLKT